jgi:hypothetical protein
MTATGSIAANRIDCDRSMMDDSHALKLALDTARAFQSGKYSPLETARIMTGIVNPWRYWWDDMGGGGRGRPAIHILRR